MFTLSLLTLISIFVINLVFGMYYGFGKRHYWFYEMLHFLGGFFVTMFLYNFTDSWQMIFLVLAVISFIWELIEYLLVKIQFLSKFVSKKFHAKPEFKLGDTVLDLFLNFTGALIFYLIT